MVRNPFIARGMIKSEKRFWGRESETQTIYSLLLDAEEEPQSVAVVGLRKIGKSSLLYRIAQKRGAQPMYADQLDRTICVMVSMQALSSASTEEFFAAVTEELSAQDDEVVAKLVVSPSQPVRDSSQQQLRQILRLMDRKEFLLVLLLDEFECAAANPNFDQNFFDLLRSMAQRWRLAFIVAIQHDLDQLWDQSLISSPYSSPFFNFFQTLTLAGFQNGQVEEYLRTLSGNARFPFESPEIEITNEVGGLHPFFLNVAAYHIFQELSRGNSQSLRNRDTLWMQITQDPTVYGNFRYYWQTLSPSRRQVLVTVARGELEQSLAPDKQVDLNWLVRMGLVRDGDDGIYEPLSRAFREFLLELGQGVYGLDIDPSDQDVTIQDLISQSEGSDLEFKSSLRWDYHRNTKHEDIEMAVVKTLAAFLNTDGGTLIIGVNDEGDVLGLEKDYATLRKKNCDGFQLHLTRLISDELEKTTCQYIHPEFHCIGGLDVCKIEVDASPETVYVGKEAVFYIRTGNSTQSLNLKEAIAYIKRHWNNLS